MTIAFDKFTRIINQPLASTRRPVAGETMLACHVIVRAYEDAFSPSIKIRTRAMGWLFSESTDWPYSFYNLCDQLGLEALALQDQLRKELTKNAQNHERRTTRYHIAKGVGKASVGV